MEGETIVLINQQCSLFYFLRGAFVDINQCYSLICVLVGIIVYLDQCFILIFVSGRGAIVECD